jgi:hypothetical protein
MNTTTIPATYQLKILAQGGLKAELEAPSSTTVGQLRDTALTALGIQPEPNVQWFLHYKGEQLNNDAETLANVIGEHDPHKQVILHLKKQPFAGASAPAEAAPEPTRTYIEHSVAELEERAEELAIEKIEVTGQDVYVTLLARNLGTGRERYTVRLRCDGYNLQPPSATMVDPEAYTEVASAWPNVPIGPGAIFRPNQNSLRDAFICAPGTREWYEHGHSEFRGPEHWTLANIVEAIHFGLNSSGYQGRC